MQGCNSWATIVVMEIIITESFKRWLSRLKDRAAIQRVQARIRRASEGNLGDSKFLRDGIGEMRIDYGPGYRIYYMRRGNLLLVLLVGGDKTSQEVDIKHAIELASEWERTNG